ncbi:putative DNA oxidative demethylase [Helianthus annuus]|nr:putative DNA oxidative demethylase [Helianthus annuus]
MRPDICLVNFYPHSGRLHPHQDLDESSDSLRRGLPVVSISIGDSAEFVYGHTRDENKLKCILLNSGDVLIFGGKSRLIYYGVMQVAQYTTPKPLEFEAGLRSGHLSLTFRQF